MNGNYTQENLIKRLNRIEGQVRGIKKMLMDNKSCTDVLIQVAAIRAAVNKVGGIIIENYSRECIKDVIDTNKKEEALNEIVDIMLKFIK